MTTDTAEERRKCFTAPADDGAGGAGAGGGSGLFTLGERGADGGGGSRRGRSARKQNGGSEPTCMTPEKGDERRTCPTSLSDDGAGRAGGGGDCHFSTLGE